MKPIAKVSFVLPLTIHGHVPRDVLLHREIPRLGVYHRAACNDSYESA